MCERAEGVSGVKNEAEENKQKYIAGHTVETAAKRIDEIWLSVYVLSCMTEDQFQELGVLEEFLRQHGVDDWHKLIPMYKEDV